MPLSDYSDKQLLEELLQRATKRDSLGLEGHQNDSLTQVSYREVVPVEGMPVPPNCEFAQWWRPSYWEPEFLNEFSANSAVKYADGRRWRVPVKQ